MENSSAIFSYLPNELHPLIYIGLLLLLSFAGGHIANYFRAPRVTGYLIVGILLGPSALGIFNKEVIRTDFGLITHIALGIIAFSIGGSLELSKIKRLGRQILWITFFQGFGAFILATVTLSAFLILGHCSGNALQCFWSEHFPAALVIGAICAATAPAATLAIVHEFRSKGPLTTILLGVVALDDGLTIFLYTFALNIAKSITTFENITAYNYLTIPFLSVITSLVIGLVMGLCIKFLIRFLPDKNIMLGVILGSIFLTFGAAETAGADPLLANMMLGFIVANYVRHHHDLFSVVEGIEEPIFGMFFALAGAHFDLKLVETAGLLAVIISIGRFLGKVSGSRLGAEISQSPVEVRKYLGLALLPTAGVTVGLVLNAQDALGTGIFSEIMVTGVLGSVILNEIFTPFLVRYSLKKAGEIEGENR
jgi:Kef-type K+ transport system membrane component KefB